MNIFYSDAQLLYTISGQIANTNSSALTITAAVTDSSNTYFMYDTADISGFFSFSIQTFMLDSIYCSYLNCNNVLNDTTLYPGGTMQFGWNSDFCPIIPPPPDTCNVSFTASYCTCDNTFYIETDTTQIGNHTVLWSFGDGTNSTQLFPTHIFTQNSLYDVCIDVYDTNQNIICNYCHSIGFDSNGNPVTRTEGGAGFNLVVVLPGSAHHEAVLASNSISISPIPSGNLATLNLFSDEATDYDIRIFNTIGQEVKFFRRSAAKGANNFSLDLSELSSGNYFMTVKMGERIITTVFVK